MVDRRDAYPTVEVEIASLADTNSIRLLTKNILK